MIEYTIRPMNSTSNSPQSYFFHYRVSLLIRSNIVWNTITVYDTFPKSPDGGADRSTASEERKSKSRVSVFQRPNNYPLNDLEGPMESTCLQVVGWSSWSLGYITNSGLVTVAGNLNTQQGLGDAMPSSHPAIVAISFMIPLSKLWAWKRRLSFI